MADEQTPYEDVILEAEGFSIPELKWRELVFIGALRPQGEGFVRDPSRPLPPFGAGDLFPPGATFRIERGGGRVHVRRSPPAA